MMSPGLTEKDIKPTESLIEKIPEISNFKINTENQHDWNCNAACHKI